MRIAVTGAGGLLGQGVVRVLRDQGHQVLAMSSSLSASSGVDVVPWEATQDWRLTADALHGVGAVIHAAAHIPQDHHDADQALRCIEVNSIGTLSLLRASERAAVRRFIYVSGANTLRPTGEKVLEGDPIGCEQSPYYLGSKVVGEIYVRSFLARGMAGMIVRPSSIYGPGMRNGVLWTFAERLRMSQPIRLRDGGRFRADYIWREDVARVLARAVASSRSGVVNLGSGRAVTLTEVVQVLCEVLMADPRLATVDPSGSDSPPPGFAAVDLSLAEEWFGFRPTTLREGIDCWLGRTAS